MYSAEPGQQSSRRTGLRGLLGAVLRHKGAAVLVLIVGLASAIISSLAVDERFEARASFEAIETPATATFAAEMDRRLRRVRRRLQSGAAVELVTRPGDRRVTVIATTPLESEAVPTVNQFTAELVAEGRGVNRSLLERRIAALQRAAEESSTGLSERAAGSDPATTERLARLRDRQVTDSDFNAATAATRVEGPEPLSDALLTLPVALLIALAVALSLDRLNSRRAGR